MTSGELIVKPAVPANPLRGYVAPPADTTTAGNERRLHKTITLITDTAWNLTAIYLWSTFIAALFGQYEHVKQLSDTAVRKISRGIEILGFSPSDPSYFKFILKAGWLLIITSFSPLQLLALFFFVLIYPFFAIGFVFMGRAAMRARRMHNKKTGARRPARFPLIAVGSAGLLSWILLYADGTSSRTVIFGLAFAALLFLGLFYRFFRRVRPIGEDDAAILTKVERFGLRILETASKYESGRPDAWAMRWLFAWINRIYRRLGILVRGRRGRDRISIYVLLEYALSALILAMSAVLFWALVIKYSIVPRSAPLSDCLRIAASHFIPGLSAAGIPVRPPFWISVCTGATAWLLFVVVLAPAGSVLPIRQAAHADRVARTYNTFRKITCLSKRFVRWLDYFEREDSKMSREG